MGYKALPVWVLFRLVVKLVVVVMVMVSLKCRHASLCWILHGCRFFQFFEFPKMVRLLCLDTIMFFVFHCELVLNVDFADVWTVYVLIECYF